MRNQQQHASVGDIFRQHCQQFLGYRVGPMQVLQLQHQRLAAAAFDAKAPQDLEALGLDRFRIRQGGQVGNVLYAQQVQQNRTVLIRIHPDLAQPGMDFVRNRFGGIRLDDAAITAQHVEREQIRDRGAVGQTPSLDPGHPAVGDPAAEFGQRAAICQCRVRRRCRPPARGRLRHAAAHRATWRVRPHGRQNSSSAPALPHRGPSATVTRRAGGRLGSARSCPSGSAARQVRARA